MKKFTLALSALLMAAGTAFAVDLGTPYVVVPADAQASGKYLTVGADGKLGYANEITSSTLWTVSLGKQDENYNMPKYLSNGDGKYLSVSASGVTVSTEPERVFVEYSQDVDGANTITSGTMAWFPQIAKPWYYLNCVNLQAEPEETEASAFFFVEASATSTDAEIQDAIWNLKHPQARVIAVGSTGAAEHGKFLAAKEDGSIYHTNTFNDYAVWEMTYDPVSEEPAIQNLGTGKYLWANGSDPLKLSDTPVGINQVASEAIIGAWGFSLDMEAKPSDYTFLNAFNINDGVGTWFLDAGSSFFVYEYDRGVTAAELEARLATDVELGLLKAPIIANVKKYMNSSYHGVMAGEWELISIENAESTDEMNAAVAEAMQKAISYAENSMEEGFVWKNTRTGQYIVNVDNAEKPLLRADSIGMYGYWFAEIEPEEETVEPQADEATYTYKKFKLRNAVTGKYVGICPGNSKVTPVATQADAAVMQLVVGNNGFELMQVNSTISNAFMNVSDNESYPELTIWSYANDAGAFFTFDALPTMTTTEAWVEIAGECKPNDWGGLDYTEVTGVNVMLPENATYNGGNIVLTVDTPDFNTDTLMVWTPQLISLATPEVKEVERSYYDYESSSTKYKTVKALVYSLPCHHAYTEAGVYMVSVDDYAFCATTGKVTSFSPAMDARADVEAVTDLSVTVTPAAGEVVEITLITIDPAGEDQHSWSTMSGDTPYNLTVTYNGEVAEDANGDKIDCSGEEFGKYDTFDFNTGSSNGYEIPVKFTAAGTYVLNIPDGFFADNNMNYNEATTVTWEVKGKDGIMQVTDVKVNGRSIYDLQGRRVSKPANGLYIINGVKTYVK